MRAWAWGVVGVAALWGPAPLAQVNTGEASSPAVEALILRAEAANERRFDAAFRDFARGRLGRLDEDELDARQDRVTSRGLGGLDVPGDARSDLVFTPLAPCRIADTRQAGGSLAAGAARPFRVTGIGLQNQGGEIDGCGVSVGGAVAALLNVVAVNPVGPGNLKAWAYSTPPGPPPAASIINYAAVPGLNIANAIALPLCDVATTSCPFDLFVQADVSATHLVMDVVGYFHRFQKETVRSFSVIARSNATTLMSSPSCTSHGQVTINAPVPGKVVVQVAAGFGFRNNAGSREYFTAMIRTTAGDCISANGGDDFRWLVGEMPAGEHQGTASFLHEFSVPAGEHTFHMNSSKVGGLPTDAFYEKTLVATFYPN